MRIVLDTNVLVSAFLSPSGPPAQILTLIFAGELTMLFDDRILEEYEEVLKRPRFELDPAAVDEVLLELRRCGIRIAPSPTSFSLPDPDDRPFIEVAIYGGADAIVTGNGRHFPLISGGFDLLSPRALLDVLERG